MLGIIIGNGDAIIQSLANALNNLLEAINKIVKSEEFQNWLNNCSDKFRKISEKIAEINWQPLIDALLDIGQNLGNIALDILSGLVDVFKWLVENPIVAEIITAIAIALSIVSTTLSILIPIIESFSIIMKILKIELLPFIGIILAIIAVVALVILAIMNWDTIMKALSDTWEWIKQKAVEIFTAIAEFFSNLWQGICDVATNVWNGIKEFFMAIWTGISTFFSDIWNGIANTISNVWNTIVTKVKEGVSGAWNAITSVFGNIGNWFHDKFSQAWQAVKNVFSTGGAIFDGIKDGILNGLKTVINAIINGINKVISIPFNGLNTALKKIRDLSIAGISPFSWIATISVPQIPALAKGGVLTQATAVLAGEYSGARSNPEIVTPQNIMYDTMRKAIEDTEFHNNNNGQTINLTVKVGNKKLGQVLLDDLRDITRQTGKDIEALVGG